MAHRIYLSISDVALLLGKSPSTLRRWEERGEIRYPRRGRNRAFAASDILAVADFAYTSGRFSYEGLQTIGNLTSALCYAEGEAGLRG